MKINIHFWSHLVHFFSEWEIFQTEVVQKLKTHSLCSRNYFYENRAVYKIIWKKESTVEQATDDNITRRMRIACWITKAKDIHSEYVMLIAFRLQQWLHERSTMLRSTYCTCLPYFSWFRNCAQSIVHH